MTRRAGRMPEIMPGDRQRLVDLTYTIWQACSEAMRIIETKSEDYKRVSKLQADALEFGRDMAFPEHHRLCFGGPGLMSRVADDKPRP